MEHSRAIENPATGLLKTPVYGAPTWVASLGLVQKADPTVDQLETATQERRVGGRRHLRGAQGGPRLMGGQRVRGSGGSRASFFTAVRGDRAATAELADRLPD